MTPLSYTIAGPRLAPATAAPATAADAYRAAAGQDPLADPAGGFGAALSRAVGGAIDAGHAADGAAVAAIEGHGSVTDMVAAMSRADLALQTTSAIRDRMVQAYQDIMRMPL